MLTVISFLSDEKMIAMHYPLHIPVLLAHILMQGFLAMGKTRARISTSVAGRKNQNETNKNSAELKPVKAAGAKRQKIEEKEKTDQSLKESDIKEVAQKGLEEKAVVATISIAANKLSSGVMESGNDSIVDHDVKLTLAEAHSTLDTENRTDLANTEVQEQVGKIAGKRTRTVKQCGSGKNRNVAAGVEADLTVKSNVTEDSSVKGKRGAKRKATSCLTEAIPAQADVKLERVEIEEKKSTSKRTKLQHLQELNAPVQGESMEVVTAAHAPSGKKFVGAHVSIAGKMSC
jgi:hypothetical protein